MKTRRRTATGWWTAVVIAAALAGGCQFKGAPMAAPPPPPSDASSAKPWQPQPAQIRIYPSTRFVRQQGKSFLVAEVELIDAMGDPIKGVGHVRCELFTVASEEGGHASPGRRLYSWDVNLVTLADQRRYYDPVTRGYLLRLELDTSAAAHETTLLRAAFTSANGRRLQTQRTLPIKW